MKRADLSFRRRTHGTARQRGKAFPTTGRTAFGPPAHPGLAREVHAGSVSDARDSVRELERSFDEADTRSKREEIRKATQLEANRLEIEAHNGRNGAEARQSLSERAKVFEAAAKRMDRKDKENADRKG